MPLRGSLRGFCGVSAGLCRGPWDFSKGSDTILVTLEKLSPFAIVIPNNRAICARPGQGLYSWHWERKGGG